MKSDQMAKRPMVLKIEHEDAFPSHVSSSSLGTAKHLFVGAWEFHSRFTPVTFLTPINLRVDSRQPTSKSTNPNYHPFN